jgi:hypothetical protein
LEIERNKEFGLLQKKTGQSLVQVHATAELTSISYLLQLDKHSNCNTFKFPVLSGMMFPKLAWLPWEMRMKLVPT